MTIEKIPNDLWNQKFFTLFRLGGIPETPKFFFQNFEISNVLQVAVLNIGTSGQIFSTKIVKCKWMKVTGHLKLLIFVIYAK